jgi:hypothetical protein
MAFPGHDPVNSMALPPSQVPGQNQPGFDYVQNGLYNNSGLNGYLPH